MTNTSNSTQNIGHFRDVLLSQSLSFVAPKSTTEIRVHYHPGARTGRPFWRHSSQTIMQLSIDKTKPNTAKASNAGTK